MTATVSIGEFARLTYLSVKTLRYYHEIELLEPAAIDPASGYRRYSTGQVEQAHLIRRLRELNMPVPEIRTVLAASDAAARDSALRAHLERMEAELARTRDVVASLRALLSPGAPIEVEYRSVPGFPALTVADAVTRDGIGDWCGRTFDLLYGALAAAGVAPAGPGGATYSPEFFENESGEVVAYVPIADADRGRLAAAKGTAVQELPGRRFAIAVHAGPFTDFDRTYGALGSYVAEHGSALHEPIRESYVVGPGDVDDPATFRTEVCWPVGRL
ncbi:DNA-binding transcriptional MerR regulator [Nocardia transvalensis]|uniref:DNA-binding transcriptional MerR regulator n=1 Tax=Nocardia transvalensis TaxID=37333 RepID=A0A7W9UHL8_9NOCA|nr:MerR family transcriptional regulator [Nocardia transvalensis]MBB5913488.1 DNA-binding transcriptional MerR regulator [Nocardia transvalensis]